MKRAIAILMMLAVLMTATNVLADSTWFDGWNWWVVDNQGFIHPIKSHPLQWKTDRLNRDFPTSVVKNTSKLRKQMNGEAMDCLGLVSTAGSNLRSKPNGAGHLIYDQNWDQDYVDGSIVRKLKADTTVYINFKVFDTNGKEWYYATCSDGQSGYLQGDRILLFPLE